MGSVSLFRRQQNEPRAPICIRVAADVCTGEETQAGSRTAARVLTLLRSPDYVPYRTDCFLRLPYESI